MNQQIDHIENLVLELKILIFGMTTKFALQKEITQISELNENFKNLKLVNQAKEFSLILLIITKFVCSSLVLIH